MRLQDQIEELRTRRAAEWLEIMSNGATDQGAAFVAWITESPRNLEEFLQITALSEETRRAVRELSLDRSALLSQLSSKVTLLPPSPAQSVDRRGRPGRYRAWVGGAALATALAVFAVLWSKGDFLREKQYATEIGQQRTLDLADGSVVYLNARSRVEVHLSRTAREIRLLEGEALFNVARDVDRPFRVQTRDVVVQAIGTQFNVAAKLDGTRVAVIEGKVQMSTARDEADSISMPEPGQEAAHGVRLSAGQAARVLPSGVIERRPASEAASAAAWRRRQLVFSGTPLEEAVQEFNRHRDSLQIRLEGVTPGSHHYSGTFDADDLESFGDLLSREGDLLVERRGNEIVVRPRPKD